MELYNFVSLLGMVLLTVIGYFFSTNRRVINWHIVVWCVGFQMLVAWFLFVFPAGVKLFYFLNDVVVKLIDSSMAGSRFLFGPLAVPPGGSEPSLGFIFAFQVFPSIIFFSSLMSILYFLNIFPWVVKVFARVFTKLMNVSGAESVCAVSNIFVGIESAVTVRPYLRDMTRSEFCVVLTSGMASVSSNVLAIYVFSLRDIFPNVAGHLISASLLSAPAAVMMAKIIVPETDQPKTLGMNIEPHIERDGSFFEAIINGANNGVKLIVGIVSLLIAVLGLVALTDQVLGFIGHKICGVTNVCGDWSLKGISGLIFYPLTVMIGIPLEDAPVMAKIIGERLIVTELTAYQNLATVIKAGFIHSERSVVVATYALCGFAHLASMAIFVGGVSALVPEKTKELADLALRSLLAATLACLMTGCIAGLFFVNGGTVLLGQ